MNTAPLSLLDKQFIVAGRGLVANPSMLRSVQRNLAPYGMLVTDQMQDSAQRARDLQRLCLQERFQFERSEIPDFFESVVKKENEGFDRMNGFIWTPEERKKISDAGLIPHETNIQHPFEMKLLGEMQATETQFKAFGLDPDSQRQAEVVNNGLLWAAQINRLNRTNNYIFRDGAIGCRGVALVTRDPFDPLGKPLVKRCRPQEFMWDPVGAEDGSLRGSKYLWRGYYVDAEDMIPRYPLFRQEIDKINFNATSKRFLFDFTLAKPKIRSKAKRGHTPYEYQNVPFRNPRKRIWVTEFFRRNKTPAFAVFDAVKGVDHVFKVDGDTADMNNWSRAEKFAGYFYNVLKQAYAYGTAAAGGNPQIDVVAQPRLVWRDTIDIETFAGDVLLDIENYDGDLFPYHWFIPEFTDGEMMGYFEHSKDDLYLASRMRIYLDLLLSGIKGHTFYDQTSLEASGITPAEFERNLTRPTKATGLKPKEGKKIDEVVHTTNPPNYGPLPGEILQYATGSINQSYGGLSTIGTADYAGQSGRAVGRLQMSAATGTVPLFKEWEYFLIEQGEAIKDELQYVSPTRLLATIDERNQAQYGRMLDSYQSEQFKVRIEEVSSSPSDREVQANLLFMLLHNNPEVLTAAFDEFADLSGVDRSRIDRIMAKLTEKENFDRLMQERAQTMQEHEVEADTIRRDREEMRKWHETQIAANPPIKTSATIQLQAGPATTSEILNQNGIPATPSGVAADHATGALMEGAKKVMLQQNWNANLTPEQKDALKGGNKEFVAKGVPTAKDEINREKS